MTHPSCSTTLRRTAARHVFWPWGLASCVLVFASAGHAAPLERSITGPRVELGEVVLDAPEEMRAIDICAAPAAGASRLLEKQVIERQIRAAGFETKGLDIPGSVRLQRAGRKFSPAELSELLTTPVRRVLPAGVDLQQVVVAASISLEENATPRPIVLPKLPRRSGTVRVAFTVEFEDAGDVPLRLPVTAILQLSPGAAAAAVRRGGRVQLMIQRGAAKISAEASALSDGDVGDELRFRVNKTGKILRAVLLSPTLAKVTE